MAIKIDTRKIEKVLKQRINAVLQTEAAKVIKETEQKHAQSDVYGAYTSLSKCQYKYVRREESGGIADINNMKVYPGDMEISVVNETPFNPAFGAHTECCRPFIAPENQGTELAFLIENGDGGGGYKYNYPFPNGFGDFRPPRPFIANTREELRNTSALHDAIVKGLRSNGLEAM